MKSLITCPLIYINISNYNENITLQYYFEKIIHHKIPNNTYKQGHSFMTGLH